uniref:Pre-mRNA-splicing factor 38 n=1 Tax=Panagrellus redivivus TaxID=6233 RepID=A0A7E4VDW9_PANRE
MADPNFHDVMGFNPATAGEVIYEDDAGDTTIPDIQKITKRNNTLPIHGSHVTMNLNPLVLENIVSSTRSSTKSTITWVNVKHLEPWERGTRKSQGMSGFFQVRGVGAGGIISSAFCLLYKLFTLKVTRKQLVSMINSTQSVYLRGIGFMFIRYTQPPADLWAWYAPYLDDDEEVDPRSGGGEKMEVGQMIRTLLTKLDWYGTLFPRIPIPIQKDIDNRLREHGRAYHGNYDNNWDRNAGNGRGPREDEPSTSTSHHHHRHRDEPRRPKRCHHHQKHYHCRKHRKKCPSKAKKARAEETKATGDTHNKSNSTEAV